MGLLSDMFQRQQNIANNPTQAIRTPQQIAYDNLLNRQANIEQQNKNYRTFNGIMSGVGGLGKIIASSMVKDPMQQAGAMTGIGEQEQRLDNLRQAYENVRNSQNKDYVTQAQQQLALAIDDEDKAYNRDLTAQQIAYKKAMDEYQKEKDKADREYKDKELNIKENAANAQINKLNAEIAALQNKAPELTEEQKIQNEINKINATEDAKNRIEANKDLQKANADYSAFKSNIDNLKDLSKKSGNTLQRSWGGVMSLFTGKDNPATAPNNAMQEVKAQLTDAIFKANGIDGDKVTKEQSKIILAKAGMPDSNTLTQSQVNTILNNIESIYKQRIASKQAYANSFNDNLVSSSGNKYSVKEL